MNKKQMSEQDIRTKYITPAILAAGWDRDLQIREEVSFTKGKITVRRKIVKRGEQKRADYILYWKPNIPLAIVEAKDNNHNIADGMEQALNYAEILDIPFVFTSNGDGFSFYDKTAEHNVQIELALDQFPSPEELWARYKKFKGITDASEKVVAQDYYYNPNDDRKPRYYQCNAINRAVEAVASGQNRLLLTMATGTGKTYTAFQIIYRLWKSRTKKRILFLADRNVLVDNPMRKDFKFFNADSNNRKMTKIRDKKVDKAYEVYFAIYQGVTGQVGFADTYKEFSPDFFDLIIVDECHRGSAKDDSAWRKILEYFKNATQIGMTATPKETKDTSNIEYFGEPIYTYTLRQGIEDGFLAPYKVVRVGIDKDLEGYRPTKGKRDKYGIEIEDREYNIKDYDKNLVLEKRTELELNSIYEKISSVCSGDVIRSKRSVTGYQRKGSDKVLNVRNLSTGLKTFVILKMLLTSGVIERNGTIILDEPEIHLHPEWQLLFAELIVLIQKEFGVHVLLNTHSPYFLNAIEVYTVKYGVDDKCKYYLAFSKDDISNIEEVTDNIEAIYSKLARPLQDLENERGQL